MIMLTRGGAYPPRTVRQVVNYMHASSIISQDGTLAC